MTEAQEKLNSEAKTSSQTEDSASKGAAERPADSEPQMTDEIAHELSELNWRDQKIAELESRLANHDQDIEKAREYVKRLEAEVKDIHLRSSREIESKVAQNVAKTLVPFLEVVDHLEKAVESPSQDAGSLQEGLRMILKQLHSQMAALGVEKLLSVGEIFNPEIHEAITAQPIEEGEDDSIISVFQEAYALNGKLIRPAKVIVGKRT